MLVSRSRYTCPWRKLYSFGAVSALASSLKVPSGNCQVTFMPAGPVNLIDERPLAIPGRPIAPPGIPRAPTAATAPGGPVVGTGVMPCVGRLGICGPYGPEAPKPGG